MHKKTRVYFVLHLLLLARRHGPVGVAQRVAVRALGPRLLPPPGGPAPAARARGAVGRTRACREFSPACAVLPLSTLCSDTPLSDHTRVFLSRLYVSRPRPRPRAAAAAAPPRPVTYERPFSPRKKAKKRTSRVAARAAAPARRGPTCTPLRDLPAGTTPGGRQIWRRGAPRAHTRRPFSAVAAAARAGRLGL